MRPYTARMTTPLPFTMIGSSLAVVEESRHPSHQQGSHIVILAGWVERGVVNPDTMGKVRMYIDIYSTITKKAATWKASSIFYSSHYKVR